MVGADCPSCEDKLASAHINLTKWFLEIKKAFPDVHISWSYRSEKEQNQFHAEGKSGVPYPLSKHNKKDDQGDPCSLALDLFQLASNGMAVWAYSYFRAISNLSKKSGERIIWGGDFTGAAKKLGDFSHFELS